MTLYARSDVMAVALSASHGGCGQVHSRPVVNGAPVKLWAFDECPQCERYLATDPHWAGMQSELPETPDEEKIRLDEEKRGQRDAVKAQAQALKEIANLPEGLATALASAFANAFAQIQSEGRTFSPLGPAAPVTVTCPDGHEVLASAKFCGECGQSVMPPLTTKQVNELQTALDAVQDDPAWQHKVKVLPAADVLESMSMAELKKLATEVGAKVTNSKEKQIALIREAQRAKED